MLLLMFSFPFFCSHSPPPSPPTQERLSSATERGECAAAGHGLVPTPGTGTDHPGDGTEQEPHGHCLVSDVVWQCSAYHPHNIHTHSLSTQMDSKNHS